MLNARFKMGRPIFVNILQFANARYTLTNIMTAYVQMTTEHGMT